MPIDALILGTVEPDPEETEMFTLPHARRKAALAAVVLSSLLAPAAHAGLLAPKTIDANTGKSPVDVGAGIGNHRAWAGFVQPKGGVDRLFVDYAQSGVWAHPFLADGGHAVDGAGLAGSASGGAVVVFSRQVNGKDALFGRRLKNGAGGPIERISASGQAVTFDGLMFPFLRGHGVAIDAAGAAAVCYAVGNQNVIATLAPGADKWVNHDADSGCTDMAMDKHGDVVSVSIANNAFSATRIVGGHVHNDTFGANLMDEDAVAVSPTGMAIAVARDTNFHIVGFELANIANSTPWTSLGRIDNNNVFDPGDSPEEPRVALDKNDNGIVIWHSNSANDPKTAFAAIANGTPQPAKFLSKESFDSFPYPAIIAPGMPAASFELPDANNAAETDSTLFTFNGANPNPPVQVAPGMAPTSLQSAAGFVGDGAGNMLMLVYQGANPQHLVAVLGDFAPPTLHPSVSPKPVAAGTVENLNSGAVDTFATLTGGEVKWTLPSGVKALAGKQGLRIAVRFNHPGRYVVKVTATDPGANTATAKLSVSVR